RKYVSSTFVPSDTTWAPFQHFRAVFLRMGLPMALDTDGLALVGHESTAGGRDPKSEFQRALTALGVSHLVAPSPQAKPNDRWDSALPDGMTAMQPVPSAVPFDLHLALDNRRRRNTDNPVDVKGRSWAIAPTLRKTVSIIHHPGRPFWVVDEPPAPPENRWPEVLGKYSL
ncbi:MAG: hypothetical protein ACKOEQ_14745, partial [Verrucomicrobiota bacterium]